MGYTDSAPPYVSNGIHRDSIVYSPQVVKLLVDRGTTPTNAVTDALVLLRVWKWNWVNESTDNLRRFSAEEEMLPWRKLSYDELAEQTALGSPRTVQRAVQRLEEQGFLLSRTVGHPEHGSQKHYLVDWTTCHPLQDDLHPPERRATLSRGGRQSVHPYREGVVVITPEMDQVSGSGSSLSLAVPDPAAFDDSAASDLCNLLAAKVETHRGARPKIGKKWLTDMSLLLRRGVKNIDGPPPEPDVVRWVIETTFSALASPDRKGFCWADQIRSPGALRDHWEQVTFALRSRPAAGVDDHAILAGMEAMRDAGL